jgi:hypothetical protein
MTTLNELVGAADPIDYECTRPTCQAQSGEHCKGSRPDYTCLDPYHKERRRALYAALTAEYEAEHGGT